MDITGPLEIALKLTKTGFLDEIHEDSQGRRMGIIRSIPVDSVLAVAWNPGRLARCRRQLAEGTKPPRIQVVGLRREGAPTLYCVTDGMHRTIAAREAGKRTIRAEVEGWYTSEPRRFVLHCGILWDTRPENPSSPTAYQQVVHIGKFPEGTDKALAEIGVRIVPDNESVFYRSLDFPTT